jgi:DNA-binding PadR family transcriptional regulator
MENGMGDPLDREIRLAFWKLHVLHHAGQGSVYGWWLLRELAAHGHHLSPGTLYPVLARMEANGWLRARAARSPKGRKSYTITAAGRRVLADVRAELDELHREVVRGQEPGDRKPRAARRRGTSR